MTGLPCGLKFSLIQLMLPSLVYAMLCVSVPGNSGGDIVAPSGPMKVDVYIVVG